MEQNKLEKEFRKQLNLREIKPSAMAWDKLDAMLSESEGKKSKLSYNWIFVAASFVGLALASTFFFNNGKTVKINDATSVALKQKTEIINQVNLSKEDQKKIISEYKIIVDHNKLKKRSNQSEKKEKNTSVANVTEDKNVLVISSVSNNPSTTKNKYISAERLLAEVSNTEFEPKATDETIKNISNGISVNPNDLLLNAETELNQSYRETALERLSKNFKSIKTVLVNRNYQE